MASKFLAVGSAVPAARLGVGAIATQAFANTLYKRDGLAHLVEGRSASETVAALLAADDGREQRQLGVVDAAGRAATFTGTECFDWAGGVHGDGYAIQGNILVGPGSPTVSELRDLGVARVSLGSTIVRAAYALVRRGASELFDAGTYTSLADEIPYGEVNALLSR